jgi:hypothetical protein
MSVLASVAELAALKEASQSHDEVLYKNERTVILRRHLPDGRTVIEKQGLGMEGQRRLRDEVAILERLMGMPGVPRLVKPQETSGWRTMAANRWPNTCSPSSSVLSRPWPWPSSSLG